MTTEALAPSGTETPPAPPAWSRRAGTAGGVLLGLVLLVAAYAKLIHPAAFVEQIAAEGLDVLLSARAVAFLALGLEVAIGLALTSGVRRLWVLVPAALLVAFFLLLTGRSWYLEAHGLTSADGSCGCFGSLVERTPKEAFLQDLALLLPALALAFVGRESKRPFPRWRAACIAALTMASLAFAAKAPELPLDDLATRLKPGVRVADVCTGRGAERLCLDFVLPEALEGEHVVVMLDVASATAGEAVPALNDYVTAGRGPRLWALAAAEPDALHRFYWEKGPVFEIREAPPSLLKPLYRRLPRSFRVREGRVVETYSSLPPLARLAG